VWSLVFTLNTALSVWLLFRHSIAAYLWIRMPVVALLGATAVAISVWGFKRCVRGIETVGS
jgi:hypothetical protein